MTPERLILDTYAYFRANGIWPFVRIIQAEYGPTISVRALAAEAGRSRVICQDGADGRLILTLGALGQIPEAQSDLSTLSLAVAMIAARFEQDGSKPVALGDVGATLGLDDLERKRAGWLLMQASRLWTAASGYPESPDFSITPGEQAFFFKGIRTFADYETRREQIERDDRRIGQLLSDEYRRARGEPVILDESSAEDVRYRLVDPELDAVLQADLAELAVVQSMGAWKSTAILAGACIETLLFDLCKRREDECVAKWAKKWPSQVNVSDLAGLAAARQWISKDHGDLIAVLRRWRNIVHAHAAVRQGPPNKELADALSAVLRLLVSDLSRPNGAGQAIATGPGPVR